MQGRVGVDRAIGFCGPGQQDWQPIVQGPFASARAPVAVEDRLIAFARDNPTAILLVDVVTGVIREVGPAGWYPQLWDDKSGLLLCFSHQQGYGLLHMASGVMRPVSLPRASNAVCFAPGTGMLIVNRERWIKQWELHAVDLNRGAASFRIAADAGAGINGAVVLND